MGLGVLEQNRNRIYNKATDWGDEMQKRIAELKSLLEAYRVGLIKENIDS